MKQANNNEVDLLLRSLARARDESLRQRGSGSADGNGTFSDHLDTDELNSYAEGAVPAPARARYTEHLADCEACRRIVIGLTQAAGTAARYETPAEQSGLGAWQKLAALFSPAVLRYAVPALVLTAVIGISLLALRQQRRPDLIAQNQPAGSSTANGQLNHPESPANPPAGETPALTRKESESASTTEPSREKNKLQEEKSRLAEVPDASAGGTVTSVPVAKDAEQPSKASGLYDLRPSPGEPKAAASATPGAMQSETDSTAFAKEQPAKREDQERRRDDTFRGQPADEHGPNRSAPPRPSGALNDTRPVFGIEAGRSGPNTQDKKTKVGEVETRTVSGRRFTRDGNAWIDSAYDSSRGAINVARGSEQFRALVADEPGLRAIAEQLKGVVIVVWKNRAYRIQ